MSHLRDGFCFFLKDFAACGILIPQAGIRTALPAVEAWSLKHWTAREVRKLQRSGSYRLLVLLEGTSLFFKTVVTSSSFCKHIASHPTVGFKGVNCMTCE